MSKTPIYNVDGKPCRKDRVMVPLMDTVVARGYGAFDSLRTYGGYPVHVEANVARFFNSARLLRLKMPCSQKELVGRIHRTIKANRFPESFVRLYVTGGEMGSLIPSGKPVVIVAVDPFHAFAQKLYDRGVALATTRLSRVLPEAKSTCYLAGVVETIEARRKGYDEVVYLDSKGGILEGTTFNVGVLTGSTLVTPEKGMLQGLTMKAVLKIAASHGVKVRRRPIMPADLKKADEVFITSTNRELIPVRKVDGLKVGRHQGWPVVWALRREYQRVMMACKK